MIETLLGLPGRVSALLGRLTETRASNLDRLDAAVTSRAPAGTALSNLVWTDAIAAKLGAMHVETPPTALPAPWILPSGVTYAGSETITAISGSFSDAYSRSGAGSLRMLAFKGISGIRVTVDGVVAISVISLDESKHYAIWGALSDGNVLSADTPLPFKTSILIETIDPSGMTPGRLYHVIVGT
jgi:hypothetical protein